MQLSRSSRDIHNPIKYVMHRRIRLLYPYGLKTGPMRARLAPAPAGNSEIGAWRSNGSAQPIPRTHGLGSTLFGSWVLRLVLLILRNGEKNMSILTTRQEDTRVICDQSHAVRCLRLSVVRWDIYEPGEPRRVAWTGLTRLNIYTKWDKEQDLGYDHLPYALFSPGLLGFRD